MSTWTAAAQTSNGDLDVRFRSGGPGPAGVGDGWVHRLMVAPRVSAKTKILQRPVGVIVNALERTRRQKHWHEELVQNSPVPVWEPAVPKATWIAEAVEAGGGLDEWNTPAARVLLDDYAGFLDRILESRS